jgi:curli biogenesis system outer membrane secretion channel CsgG
VTRTPLLLLSAAAALAGCATVTPPAERAESPVPAAQQKAAQQQALQPTARRFKLKIAVGRFTNETNYGRSLLTDAELDRIGKQASDMMVSRLVDSGQFLVLERSDLGKVEKEQALTGMAGLVGADTLVIGSVTEFGRTVGGKSGFLSSTKVQIAKARVDVRLVDVRTGLACFSAFGTGQATTESGEVAGFGSHSEYDATLNDRAIGAAVSDVTSRLAGQLADRKWRTDILETKGAQIFISGGKRQGLKPGDVLSVMQAGATVKSRQTGFDVSLPSTPVAKIRVVALFGDTETSEGSVCELVAGQLPSPLPPNLFVSDDS